ncbi:ABC transporter ATP-binding protein [Vibrio sp.]|nr:ABC transporter ATP-binding protein [Vibrio sp.]
MEHVQSPLLAVNNLSVTFSSSQVKAVDNLSFTVAPGETLAIVGESGSGKSVTSMSIMRLIEQGAKADVTGRILFGEGNNRKDVLSLTQGEIESIRGNDIAMIYQEPMTSLNPVLTIGSQICEAILLHQTLSFSEAKAKTISLLEKVRLPDAEALFDRYPHQLSGGMRQRVMIAMALSCEPKLLIADEPTTALDVSIQAQILYLIRDLQKEFNTAVIFITHDMGVVAEMADRVVVMHRGQQLEHGSVHEIFHEPKHPYTQALLAAVPKLGSMEGEAYPKRLPLLTYEDGQLKTVGESAIQDTAQYDKPILEIDNISTHFDVKRNFWGKATHRVFAVDNVSFDIYPGETLALVGESGSGKSTIGKSIQQLEKIRSGDIRFKGESIYSKDKSQQKVLRQKIQYIFQDAFAALNPKRRVGDSIIEPIETHKLIIGKENIQARLNELLKQVGLDESYASRYPHELSGGQRARVGIARALACEPELIIADESIAALDVSIQAHILNLLMELQQEYKLAFLFITHDMAVVEKISHRVAVLYLGQFVEYGTRQAIFENPTHSYTKKLLSAVPVADPSHIDKEHVPMDGEIPSPVRSVTNPPIKQILKQQKENHWVAEPA